VARCGAGTYKPPIESINTGYFTLIIASAILFVKRANGRFFGCRQECDRDVRWTGTTGSQTHRRAGGDSPIVFSRFLVDHSKRART